MPSHHVLLKFPSQSSIGTLHITKCVHVIAISELSYHLLSFGAKLIPRSIKTARYQCVQNLHKFTFSQNARFNPVKCRTTFPVLAIVFETTRKCSTRFS